MWQNNIEQQPNTWKTVYEINPNESRITKTIKMEHNCSWEANINHHSKSK